MGGMVLETNMNEIVAQIEAQNRLEKSEVSTSCTSAPASSAREDPVREDRGRRRKGCMCWFVLLGNFRNVYTPLLSSLSPSKLIGRPADWKASPEN